VAHVGKAQRPVKKTKTPSVTVRVADAHGAGWLVTITDRPPRAGERAAWLIGSDLEAMLCEQLRPMLDEQGLVRPGYAKDGVLRLGVLYTYDPDPHESVHRWARLTTVEVKPLDEKVVQP
jgi:hypothetical protein